MKLQVDHMVPRALGGGDELCNLVTACATCNFSKRDKILGDEWFPKIQTSGWYWDNVYQLLPEDMRGPR